MYRSPFLPSKLKFELFIDDGVKDRSSIIGTLLSTTSGSRTDNITVLSSASSLLKQLSDSFVINNVAITNTTTSVMLNTLAKVITSIPTNSTNKADKAGVANILVQTVQNLGFAAYKNKTEVTEVVSDDGSIRMKGAFISTQGRSSSFAISGSNGTVSDVHNSLTTYLAGKGQSNVTALLFSMNSNPYSDDDSTR